MNGRSHSGVTIRLIEPKSDLAQIQTLFDEIYTYSNFWKLVLIRGTIKLFWKEISLLTAASLFLKTALLGGNSILSNLSTFLLIFLSTVILGLRKLNTTISRFANVKDHFQERLEKGDTIFVAETHGEIVGTLGVQWGNEVS